jgi:hypothetical protein
VLEERIVARHRHARRGVEHPPIGRGVRLSNRRATDASSRR